MAERRLKRSIEKVLASDLTGFCPGIVAKMIFDIGNHRYFYRFWLIDSVHRIWRLRNSHVYSQITIFGKHLSHSRIENEAIGILNSTGNSFVN